MVSLDILSIAIRRSVPPLTMPAYGRVLRVWRRIACRLLTAAGIMDRAQRDTWHRRLLSDYQDAAARVSTNGRHSKSDQLVTLPTSDVTKLATLQTSESSTIVEPGPNGFVVLDALEEKSPNGGLFPSNERQLRPLIRLAGGER